MTVETPVIVAVLVAAGFVRGALGFGDALVAMPLLALLLPTRTAAPLVASTATLIAAVILFRDWRHVVLRPATLLTVFGLVGVPLGVWWLKHGDDRLMKGLLGLVVLGFSIWSLTRVSRPILRDDRLAPVFGVVAGLLGGAYNISGPPLAIFGTMRGWSPPQFRATLQSFWLVASIWIVLMLSLNGLLTRHTITHVALGAPLIVVATLVGRRITNAMAADRFTRITYAVLLVVGGWLMISSLVAGTRVESP
jgi:uncharacterized membrane protein YfcA